MSRANYSWPAVCGAGVGRTAASRQGRVFFFRQIAPVLEQNCLRCHGKQMPRGGLSLTTAADLLAGGDSGPVVIAGKPSESLLVEMISGDKPKMPKKARPSTKAQVDILKKWIAEGANWPKGRVLRQRSDDRETWWSLRPLARPAVPAVKTLAWVHTPVDARLDAGNRLLWRMNRRRLDAESIRDAVLAVSGKVDLKMYGPGFRTFGFLDDHSPHYKYEEYNPDDPAGHHSSIYRFLVRSAPDPFMETLDGPDPSLRVEKRNESLTALQAPALLSAPASPRACEPNKITCCG